MNHGHHQRTLGVFHRVAHQPDEIRHLLHQSQTAVVVQKVLELRLEYGLFDWSLLRNLLDGSGRLLHLLGDLSGRGLGLLSGGLRLDRVGSSSRARHFFSPPHQGPRRVHHRLVPLGTHREVPVALHPHPKRPPLTSVRHHHHHAVLPVFTRAFSRVAFKLRRRYFFTVRVQHVLLLLFVPRG